MRKAGYWWSSLVLSCREKFLKLKHKLGSHEKGSPSVSEDRQTDTGLNKSCTSGFNTHWMVAGLLVGLVNAVIVGLISYNDFEGTELKKFADVFMAVSDISLMGILLTVVFFSVVAIYKRIPKVSPNM